MSAKSQLQSQTPNYATISQNIYSQRHKIMEEPLTDLQVKKVDLFEENYFKALKLRFRISINKIYISDTLYFFSFGVKKKEGLCVGLPGVHGSKECQVIAAVNQNNNYQIGFAFESEGFPFDQKHSPVFAGKLPFEEVKSFDKKGHHFHIHMKNDRHCWDFKFEEKSLAEQWCKLFEQLRHYRVRNDKPNSKESEQEEKTDQNSQSFKQANRWREDARSEEKMSSQKMIVMDKQTKEQQVTQVHSQQEKDSFIKSEELNIECPFLKSENEPLPQSVCEPQERKDSKQLSSEPSSSMIFDPPSQSDQSIQKIKKQIPKTELEIWREKYEDLAQAKKNLTFQLFEKDDRIKMLELKVDQHSSDDLIAKKIRAERQNNKAKDMHITKLNDQLAIYIEKDKLIQELTRRVKESKEETGKLETMKEEVRKKEQQQVSQPKQHIDQMIKNIQKDVIKKDKAIEQLDQQNKKLLQNDEEQGQISEKMKNLLKMKEEGLERASQKVTVKQT